MAKIYVACLSAYNSGILHGEWLDVTDPDTMGERIAAMLAKSPVPDAEEYAVHDYDDCPGNWGEHPDLDALCEFIELVDKHGDAYTAYVDHVGEHYATAKDFEERYAGEYDSPEDYAADYIESCGLLDSMPENLRNYFDYEAFARDMQLEGSMYFADAPGGKVFAFYNN